MPEDKLHFCPWCPSKWREKEANSYHELFIGPRMQGQQGLNATWIYQSERIVTAFRVLLLAGHWSFYFYTTICSGQFISSFHLHSQITLIYNAIAFYGSEAAMQLTLYCQCIAVAYNLSPEVTVTNMNYLTIKENIEYHKCI